MKVTVEFHGDIITYETEGDEQDVYQMYQIWTNLLKAMGYQQKSIADAVGEGEFV